jgi:ribokinase
VTTPLITVVGSINLDFVAIAEKLPAPGETVVNAVLERHPGGKGANQALAARRLGAEVRMIGCVGDDPFAVEALRLLRDEEVDTGGCRIDPIQATGVALIAVSRDGENQIVVASGANAAFRPEHLPPAIEGALLCQLEIPQETIAAAMERTAGFVVLNLAPAAKVPDAWLARADLIVVNELESVFYGPALQAGHALVAVTQGSKLASLYRGGELIASQEPPKVEALDTTGAGDCFVAAPTLPGLV